MAVSFGPTRTRRTRSGLRLSAFRHPGADRGGPVDLAAARRILVVRPDNIGDVVLLTPALRALRAAAPQARIELLASPAGRPSRR